MQVAKILLLCDLIESYSMELKLDSKHLFKQKINDVLKATNRMVKIADKHVDNTDVFGDDADLLKEQIDNLIDKL